MEPAIERREHRGLTRITIAYTPPQWSPPSDGGSTSGWVMTEYYDMVPQWSPPSNGGSTPANGWALLWSSAPQWSPPSTAGSMQFAFEGLVDDEEPQ